MSNDVTEPINERMAVSNRRGAGFSLIEVCLAVLVLGLGLLPIFGLLPSGLRSAEESTADTRCGLFTESVMNGLRENSVTLTNWIDDWNAPDRFASSIVKGVLSKGGVRIDAKLSSTDEEIQFPDGKDWLRYRLSVDTNAHSATLEVCDGRYGAFEPQVVAYTEFIFRGP